MFNPIKLYARSQEVQLNWIRKHPIQWLVLNAAIFVVFVGYMEFKDYQEMRKWNAENATINETDI